MIVPNLSGTGVRTLTPLKKGLLALLKGIKPLVHFAAFVTCAGAIAANDRSDESLGGSGYEVKQADAGRCPSFDQSPQTLSQRLRLQQGSLIFLPARPVASQSKVVDVSPADAIVPLTGNHSSANRHAGASILEVRNAKLAPSSPLLTNPELQVKLAGVEWAGHTLTMLFTDDTFTGPRLLALIMKRQGSASSDASYYWFPFSGNSSKQHPLNLAALEHLYRFAVSHVATDRFRFSIVMNGQADERILTGNEMTHAQLLDQIASARSCVASELTARGAEPAKPWRTVSLEAIPMMAIDKMVVAARVSDTTGPVAGAMISFFREPHFDCSAKSNKAGLAICHLEDTHGHDGSHDHAGYGPGSARTIATYPGNIRTEMIMLPTTSVW